MWCMLASQEQKPVSAHGIRPTRMVEEPVMQGHVLAPTSSEHKKSLYEEALIAAANSLELIALDLIMLIRPLRQ